VNRALWLLLGLQMRGWGRYLKRSVGTVRGAFLVLVGLAVFLPWLLVVVTNAGGGLDRETLLLYGPLLLLVYCTVNVVFSPQDRAIYFTPAEVQFLFAGPFGRREVLAYKVLLSLLVSVPATLVMGAVVRLQHGWPPAVLAGLFLISAFMQLFSMVLGLLGNFLGAHLFSRGRRLAGALLLALLLAALAQAVRSSGTSDLRALLDRILDTPIWRTASWPLRCLFEAMTAERFWPDLLAPFAVGLAVDFGLVAVVFSLDRYYQEASAAASARLYARQQRMRGRSAGAETTSAPASAPPLSPRTLPWWGGIGPILWRQMTTALRGVMRLILVLFVIGVLLSISLFGFLMEHEEMLLPTVVILGAWSSIFLTALVPFDFRGDIDRIGLLKTLPIVTWRLVIGQLLTPVILLSLMQWLALAAALAVVGNEVEVLALTCFVPPFNFVLVAIENLLFLLFPVRLMAATPGDFQSLGRNVLLSLGKVIGLGLVGLAAALVGLVVWFVTGETWLGVAAAWPVVLAAGVALTPLVGLAFTWFDVGRDTPA
jgi:hypothetical protein